MSEKCGLCGNRVRSGGRTKYTPESFKSAFKVGDMVCGWGTGLTLMITAIGEKRVLLMDHRDKERTCMIEAQHGWVAVKESS